ncbi:DUF3093 family protein [Pseudonocardia endophytica]|uniref:DUF3093 family protein n=1 Tax=Pseudonocardia endophytica TaxID=401976 RepID=A0A4R1HUX2_PSEEN|nr:DUF3093 family protein [Pseudonocardia endophytica]
MPLWWYVPAAGLGLLLGAEVHMGYPGFRSWIGYLVLIPLCVAALWWLGRSRVRVEGDTLGAGDRSVALRHVGRTDVVERGDKQEALGPDLDPTAFLLHRAWIGRLVRIEITDPDAPEPYWVLSSRDPERLVAALEKGRKGR